MIAVSISLVMSQITSISGTDHASSTRLIRCFVRLLGFKRILIDEGTVSLGHGLGIGSLPACAVAIASASGIGVALAFAIEVALAATAASAVTVAAIDSSSCGQNNPTSRSALRNIVSVRAVCHRVLASSQASQVDQGNPTVAT